MKISFFGDSLNQKPAALMAGFTRSILSGGTAHMSIDDFLEMEVKSATAGKGWSKAQKKVAGGQLTLF